MGAPGVGPLKGSAPCGPTTRGNPGSPRPGGAPPLSSPEAAAPPPDGGSDLPPVAGDRNSDPDGGTRESSKLPGRPPGPAEPGATAVGGIPAVCPRARPHEPDCIATAHAPIITASARPCRGVIVPDKRQPHANRARTGLPPSFLAEHRCPSESRRAHRATACEGVSLSPGHPPIATPPQGRAPSSCRLVY